MAKVKGTGVVSQDLSHWWLVALLGLISIAAGILAVAYPDITLLVLGLIVGINLLIIGAVWIYVAATEPILTEGSRFLRYLAGFLATLAGLFCVVRPGAGVLVLLISLSFWFILAGMVDLTRAFEEKDNRVISALLGVVSIAAGVIIVADPNIGLATLALLAGIGFMVRGIIEVVAAANMYRLGH